MARFKTDVLREATEMGASIPPAAQVPNSVPAAMEVRPVLFKAPDGQVVQAYQLSNTQVVECWGFQRIVCMDACVGFGNMEQLVATWNFTDISPTFHRHLTDMSPTCHQHLTYMSPTCRNIDHHAPHR